MKVWGLIGVLYGFGVAAHFACSTPPTLKQAGAVTEAGCTLLRAFADSPEEEAMCAAADDILGLMADVRAQREDSGPVEALKGVRKAGKCQIVGTVCATDAELAPAIRRVSSRDAGK